MDKALALGIALTRPTRAETQALRAGPLLLQILRAKKAARDEPTRSRRAELGMVVA